MTIFLRLFLKFTKYNKIFQLSDKKPVIRDSLLNLLENRKNSYKLDDSFPIMKLQATSFPKSRPSPDGTNHKKNGEKASHSQTAKISLYLQSKVTPKTSYQAQLPKLEKTSYSILVSDERDFQKLACRVSFILVIHVKTAVIQSLRKADYGSDSLKFAIFRHFVPI